MSGGPFGRGKAPERRVMPLQCWPEADRKIWLAATTVTDPFADTGGDRANMRAHSNRRLQSSYGRWLTYLDLTGQLDLHADPALRIGRGIVEQYVRELQALGNMPSTIALRLTDLLLMARLFDARTNWGYIARLAEKVRAMPAAGKDKRLRLRGSDELRDLGQTLMDKAATETSPLRAATLHRDGLMIALLALVPLRGANFVQLRFETELRQMDGRWTVTIAGNTTKTHAPVDFDWPPDLAPALETYLATYRPVLASRRYRWLTRAGDHLWVAQTGSALTQMAFYDIVMKHTKAAFGVAINPHAFRDAAATTIAIHDPEHARTAAPVLGHRSPTTTEKHYNQAMSLDAHRRYTSVLAQFRRPVRRPNP